MSRRKDSFGGSAINEMFYLNRCTFELVDSTFRFLSEFFQFVRVVLQSIDQLIEKFDVARLNVVRSTTDDRERVSTENGKSLIYLT